jgi:dTDP-4-amino-4,6-dideoxygalactose transaminase
MTTAVRVPYVNLADQHAPLKAELLAAVESVLDSGQFILGDDVQQFEQRFAELCRVRCAVGVNSGTDALYLALQALGIGPGDEVISVPNSFIATTAAIVMVGARPVFVDIGDDGNMDPALLEGAITPRTRAVLPVHLTGRPADMDPILAVAQKHGLPVVEDCAQAVLAESRGRRVGSFGAVGCFSLHPLKTLNACGDGGVLTTNDPALAERLRVRRNLGLRTRDDCVVWSGNSRLDNLQAAILLVKLRYLERWTVRRRMNAAFYRAALEGVPDVTLPGERPWERAVYHTFVIQAERRDELKQYLLQQGIETAIHYPVPIHLHRAAAGLNLPRGSFPVSERQADRILSLPVYPELTEVQRQAVADAIREFFVTRCGRRAA